MDWWQFVILIFATGFAVDHVDKKLEGIYDEVSEIRAVVAPEQDDLDDI